MKKNIDSIIEEITLPNTAADLWDELYNSQSSQVILSFRDGTGYKFRLLGPFVLGSRVFLAPNFKFYEYMTPKELKQLLRGDADVKKTVIQRILNKTPDSIRRKLHVESTADIKTHTTAGRKFSEMVNVIENICHKTQWQPIVFSNVVVLETNATYPTSNPAIICLSKNLCYQILNEIIPLSKDRKDAADKPISGLYAHDIMIARQGQGINSKYTVRLSKQPEHLPNQLISYVLKEGLWDMHEIVKTGNKKVVNGKMNGFIYRIGRSCKMSTELMSEIFEQTRKVDDAAYMDAVEEEIADLPKEAFESYANENSISSLDL